MSDNKYCADNNVFTAYQQEVVFNIQKYTLHDGPGIRTLVFMKGCPLHCLWCSNPESQNNTPEIAFDENRCIGHEECGWCVETCPAAAIKQLDSGKVKIDRKICTLCGKCSELCPSKAIHLMGKSMTINDILKVVQGDDSFYWRSGGGITVGGGDPICQPDFTRHLLSKCRDIGIDTAIETSGHGNFTELVKISQHANLVYYDIKHIDPVKHKAFTGVTNELILENLVRLGRESPQTPIIVRTPVIPGFNDSEEVIKSIVNFLDGIKNLLKYELLPYHAFGESKYYKLGRRYALAGFPPPGKELMMRLKEIIYKAGLE